MASIQVDVFVDAGSTDRLFHAMETSLGMTEIGTFLLAEVDPFLRSRIADRFAGEGDDVTGPWLPLAATTQAIRAGKGYPAAHPINARDHYMEAFLTGRPGDMTVNGLEAVLTHPGPGSPLTDQKIKTAQMGKAHPNTPPRPVLGVNDADLLFIHAMLTAHLFSGV